MMQRVRIISGLFAELKDRVVPIRFSVFVKEQYVPVELEQDDRDEFCVHVLACIDNLPVGTGRIDLERGGKIGRVAVLPAFRRNKTGLAIVQKLEEIAIANDLKEVFLNAQVDVIPFYEQLGYVAVGERFNEAGIVHLKMTKRLEPLLI